MVFKNYIAKIINQLGYEVKRKPHFDNSNSTLANPFEDQKRIAKILQKDIKYIFDIGANIGQTAIKYRKYFPDATVYSFEPIKYCYDKVFDLSKNDPMIVPFNIALDCKQGYVDFHEMYGSQTSSLLLPSNDVSNFYAAGYFNVKKTTKVPSDTIDNICTSKNISEIDILKLDTQGTEDKVLLGGENILQKKSVTMIFTEVSFTEVYTNQVLFFELCNLLHRYGYHLYTFYEVTKGSNGVLVGSDALFLKKEVYDFVVEDGKKTE